MPKNTKTSTRKKNDRSQSVTALPPAQVELTPEYQEYLERYGLYGEGRPKLSPTEFDKLDDELLELLAVQPGRHTDEQIVRMQELEFLLIDTE